ncbi:MAG: glycoside hydrolase family 130 protein [Spirochaetales bacterium]|nr:glycoside hydrolase family 130 protein [Spirochaetales bacterium]
MKENDGQNPLLLRTVPVQRKGPTLAPDSTRVLLRPFHPVRKDAARRIINRIMTLPEDEVNRLLARIMKEFEHRHEQVESFYLHRFQVVEPLMTGKPALSAQRKALIGSCFSHEYSPEAAALFNPSIVPHPDQGNLPKGSVRFILSLRATGEGHISSVTFRIGIVDRENTIALEPAVPYVTEPAVIENLVREKSFFARQINESGLRSPFCKRVAEHLPETFSLDDLKRTLEEERRKSSRFDAEDDKAAHDVLLLVESNYQVRFPPESCLSQRILFPSVPSQSNGIEDARFVRFRKDDGSFTYYATYTAYDGRNIQPQLIETPDFLHFTFISLSGAAARNKGMALFPQTINGRYAMLSRQDGENIFLMYSDTINFWQEEKLILEPRWPWEFMKIGTCGSPIETDEGYLVLSHGVGPMRKYCLGAFLLDLKNPAKVIGRLSEPLLSPNETEREGYVPNVVYTCGAMLHGKELILPYAMSDHATSFATVRIDELIKAMV